MRGLDPRISLREALCPPKRDGRDKPGHDGNGCALSFLEIRRHFFLLEIRCQIFLDRDVYEGGPDRRLRRIGIEMLVLDSAWLHRQQHEITLLPIFALALDDGVALAFQHVDDEPALMSMFAGARLDVMDEHAPLLQRRVLEGYRIEKELQLALPRLEPLLLGAVDHRRTGEVALGQRLALRHHPLIGIVFDRRPLALAHAFDFSHRVSPVCYALRRYSGASSSCSKPQPRSTDTPSTQFGSTATNFAGCC